MKTVSVIFTQHEENGLTSIPNLLGILERIKPEVIFLEVPAATFGDYFNDADGTLESHAVRRYRENHLVDLRPVDLATPEANFFTNSRKLFERIEKTSVDYCRFVDCHSQYVNRHGFQYLNSDHCSDRWLMIYEAMQDAIERLGDPGLAEFHASWIRTNGLRDEAMMTNIEHHCRQASFDKAAFLVGAAHRQSIIGLSRRIPGPASSTVRWDFARVAVAWDNEKL